MQSLPPPGDIPALRAFVRALIAAHEGAWPVTARASSWLSGDPAFSRALGAAGLIGMTWPRAWGGHERDPLERYAVLEELLAAGAPVGLHWIADRQTGPLLLRYGSDAQRQRYLPGIARGELYTCIGLSEPGAGSDLAAVRTRARRTAEGWRIDGQKLWTSGAHCSHAMLALVRTGEGSERHAGLSQLLIDLATPGITVRPIPDLTGAHHFNEVFFENVLVPPDALVGSEGEGWRQVTAELAFERSGPERYLSSQWLFGAFTATLGPDPAAAPAQALGRMTAELWTLRQLSQGCAAQLAAGEDPMLAAAIVKDLGNAFEQAVPRAVQAALPVELAADDDLARLLALQLVQSQSYNLRGGVPEVLRGIIARALGVR